MSISFTGAFDSPLGIPIKAGIENPSFLHISCNFSLRHYILLLAKRTLLGFYSILRYCIFIVLLLHNIEGTIMDRKFIKFIWLALIILAIYIWTNKDDLSLLLNSRPNPESLEFNKSQIVTDNRPIVVSKDEEINIDVFEKIHPAVVNIVATTLSVNFWMQLIPTEGQGSGFIIDREGYILTNNHVVENAQEITVTLLGGEKMNATLVGRDPTSDLAVIKIPSEGINEVAPLGDSDQVKVGQKAIAIGNPFGLSHTLTTGIVSALNRSIMTSDDTQIDDLIQTDAAINPGNSGGPLLNSSGEVIGINTAIFSLSGGYQGIGFAIPINRAKEIATELITTGRVARPWLGINQVSIAELSPYLDFGIDKGILVVQVIPGGSADRAGLRGGDRIAIIGRYRLPVGGDIITAIDDYPISEVDDIDRILKKKKVGETLNLRIHRNDRLMEIPVTLMERP
jgi:putative serine protease PepD